VLEGKPTTIVKDGRFLPGAARRPFLRPTDVEHAIRVQNGDDIKEVAAGVMEPTGNWCSPLRRKSRARAKATSLTSAPGSRQCKLRLSC
jgi:uncharacterized membrane protein YcaP (DUF421 family)